MSLEARLSRVRYWRDERVRGRRRDRQVEWLQAGLLVVAAAGFFLLGLRVESGLGVSGFLDRPVDQVISDGSMIGGDSTQEGVEVFVEDGEAESFRVRFNDSVETGWCVYGRRNASGFVVEEVQWIGRYGDSGSVSFSCESWRGDFLGRVHNHPDGVSPELSVVDAHSLGAVGSRRLSGVVVSYWEGCVEVGWFTGRSLKDPFASTLVRD